MRNRAKGQIDIASSEMNDNVDSLGGYSSITTSAEMVEFINGLEESEIQRESAGNCLRDMKLTENFFNTVLRNAQGSAASMQRYLAGGQ